MVSHVDAVVYDRHLEDDSSKPILCSAMGEGEPLLAYRAVVTALQSLSRMRNSRIALSTSGVKPNHIRDLAHEEWQRPLKLQLSIHAPSDAKRRQLIPLSASLADILNAADHFAEKTGFPVELNYVLFDQINDSPEDAVSLAKIVTGRGWVIKVNRFNRNDRLPFRESSTGRANEFLNILQASGATVEGYETDGSDISAACGQLSYSVVRKSA